MTSEEIMIRRLTNQYLIRKGAKLQVISDLCGFQAQFLPNAVHSARIRCCDFSHETFSDGLVKNWTIRGTVHVFAEDDLPVFLHRGNGKLYRSEEWSGYYIWKRRDGSYCRKDENGCEKFCVISPERQKLFSRLIIKAVYNASKTRDELKRICFDGGMTETEAEYMFDSWGGGIRELCERGFMNYAVQEKKIYVSCPDFTPISEEKAKLELARRYFTNFAPATVRDAVYFFGAKQSEVKKWLSALPAKNSECEGGTYFYIDSGGYHSEEIPDCVFLAGFDQLMLGYRKDENLFLPTEYLRNVFSLTGIVFPSILLHGKVAGKWKKKNGILTIAMFKNVNKKDKKTIINTAENLWNDINEIVYE